MLESGREAITVSEVDSFASRLNAILVSDMSTVSGVPGRCGSADPPAAGGRSLGSGGKEPILVHAVNQELCPPPPCILRTCLVRET